MLKQDAFVCAQVPLFWGGGVAGRERVAGACRLLEEPSKMVPVHGALVVKYTFPSLSLPFYFGSMSCLSCEELLALGTFWVAEGRAPPPTSLQSLGSDDGGPVLWGCR